MVSVHQPLFSVWMLRAQTRGIQGWVLEGAYPCIQKILQQSSTESLTSCPQTDSIIFSSARLSNLQQHKAFKKGFQKFYQACFYVTYKQCVNVPSYQQAHPYTHTYSTAASGLSGSMVLILQKTVRAYISTCQMWLWFRLQRKKKKKKKKKKEEKKKKKINK